MTSGMLHQTEENSTNLKEFNQLCLDHKKHVFAIALSILRDFELSEDVLQEVYIKLYQYMKHHDISNVKAWLIHVARNTALKAYI